MHKKIVVITDDASMHDSVSAIIKQTGHECVFIPFRACSREFLEHEMPQFIICDDHPAQYEVRHVISSIPVLSNVPVLAYIDHASDVVLKPIFDQVIHDKIRKYVGSGTKSKHTLLIIEDEVDLCRTLAFRFEKWGFNILIAHDGDSGLAMAQKELPDIIILDLQLPKKTGEEVCKAIRDHEETERIPIIMCTAKDSPVDRIIGKVIGANAYITKPFDIGALHETVVQLLQ